MSDATLPVAGTDSSVPPLMASHIVSPFLLPSSAGTEEAGTIDITEHVPSMLEGSFFAVNFTSSVRR